MICTLLYYYYCFTLAAFWYVNRTIYDSCLMNKKITVNYAIPHEPHLYILRELTNRSDPTTVPQTSFTLGVVLFRKTKQKTKICIANLK